MRGIILAGGTGSRLYPATRVTCKQLLPVYDKPLIYYPLSTLMLAGITEILIITTPEDLPRFTELFGDGSHLGLSIEFAVQDEPRGLADAFIIAESFIGTQRVALVLGDNIFYGHSFEEFIRDGIEQDSGATIFGYYVKNPSRYGVVDFDRNGTVLSIIEKPEQPRSNFAVVGLYFYDNTVIEKAKSLQPSPRGELEITDINRLYLQESNLKVKLMGRGFAWLDTGTHESLLEASQYVEVIEARQGLKIACIEEIAFRKGYINLSQLEQLGQMCANSSYGSYILDLVRVEKSRELGD